MGCRASWCPHCAVTIVFVSPRRGRFAGLPWPAGNAGPECGCWIHPGEAQPVRADPPLSCGHEQTLGWIQLVVCGGAGEGTQPGSRWVDGILSRTNNTGQNCISKAILPGSAEGSSGGGGTWFGQILTGNGVTRAILTTKCWCVWPGVLGDAWYDPFCDFSRFCWLLFASLQHHAFHLLQHQRGVLLCQQEWQVLLAVYHCPHPHDARGQSPDPTVHQQVLCVWSPFPGCGCAQPGHHHPTVSPGLAQPVDRILLPHGKDTAAVAEAALNISSLLSDEVTETVACELLTRTWNPVSSSLSQCISSSAELL